MASLIGRGWAALTGWLGGTGKDKLLHFIAGLVVAALFGIVLHWGRLSVLPAVAAGLLKEAADQLRYKGWDWADLLATALGGAYVSTLYFI